MTLGEQNLERSKSLGFLAVVGVVLAIIVSCQSSQASPQASDGPDRWIFDADQASEQEVAWIESVPWPYWTPTEADTSSLEDRLRQEFTDADYGDLGDRFESYDAQIAGYTTNGAEVVLGNYFCADHQLDDSQLWVSVTDGGDCYFRARWNTETDEVSVVVNGEA